MSTGTYRAAFIRINRTTSSDHAICHFIKLLFAFWATVAPTFHLKTNFSSFGNAGNGWFVSIFLHWNIQQEKTTNKQTNQKHTNQKNNYIIEQGNEMRHIDSQYSTLRGMASRLLNNVVCQIPAFVFKNLP